MPRRLGLIALMLAALAPAGAHGAGSGTFTNPDMVFIPSNVEDTSGNVFPFPILTSPANMGTGDTWGSPVPADPGTLLSAFDDRNPLTDWGLFIRDDAGGSKGTMS